MPVPISWSYQPEPIPVPCRSPATTGWQPVLTRAERGTTSWRWSSTTEGGHGDHGERGSHRQSRWPTRKGLSSEGHGETDAQWNGGTQPDGRSRVAPHRLPDPIRQLTLAQFGRLLQVATLVRGIADIHVHHTWRPRGCDFRGLATTLLTNAKSKVPGFGFAISVASGPGPPRGMRARSRAQGGAWRSSRALRSGVGAGGPDGPRRAAPSRVSTMSIRTTCVRRSHPLPRAECPIGLPPLTGPPALLV